MKNRFLCTIVLALLLVSAAQATDYFWRYTDGTSCGGEGSWWPGAGVPFAVDNDWSNQYNWAGQWVEDPPGVWKPGFGVPTASDNTEFNRQTYTEVGTGDAAVCARIYVGTDWTHTLGVVGGTLTVGGQVILGRGGGTLGSMYIGGGTTSVADDLIVGGGGVPSWGWGPGVGDLDMAGGIVNIVGSLVVGGTETDGEVSQTGTGTFTIDGGLLVAMGLTIETGSHMGVYDDGLVVLAGDQLDLVNGYIQGGLLYGLASIADSGPYEGNTVIETPEPATLTLFTLAGIALLRRRKM